MTEFKYTYSLVIPHFNSANLLKRMLASIPEREDIQVIVVDDGSKDEEKQKLATLEHRNLQIIYSPKNYGGGIERNVGFEKVEGKWFIGCDADDFFSEGAFDVLDKYKDSDIDYLCYCVQAVDDIDLKPVSRYIRSDESVRKYIKSKNKKTVTLFKMRNFEPWNKMVSVAFMRENGIRWENCKINIDVLFGLSLGVKGKKTTAIEDILYNCVITSNSITRTKRSIEREFGFFIQAVKRNGIYRSLGIGFPLYRPEWLYYLFLIKKRGIKDAISFFKYKKGHQFEVDSAYSAYTYILEGIDIDNLFNYKN